MRKFLWVRHCCCFVVFSVFLVFSSIVSAKTQGFEECKETCFSKECGEAGERCPTASQKRRFRSLCHGKCVEQMKRQDEQRIQRAHERKLALLRARSQKTRELLLLKHKLWVKKRETVARLRLQYERAKKEQSPKTVALLKKMQRAYAVQMRAMRRKLAAKESFYRLRKDIRQTERKEYVRRIKKLKQRLAKASTQKDEPVIKRFTSELAKEKKLAYEATKKAALLQVNLLDTRVQQKNHAIKEIKVERKQIKQASQEAKQSKNKKKLMALAKRLGALAGQQAALSRQAELEKLKLKKAKVVLTSVKSANPDSLQY